MNNHYIHVLAHKRKYSLHVLDVKKLWKIRIYPTPPLPRWPDGETAGKSEEREIGGTMESSLKN